MRPAVPKAIRYTLLSLRDLLVSAGPFAVLAIGLLVLAYLWLDPTPPHRVTLATGPAQSAYDEIGQRYRKALAANGIDVVLLPSQGSSDNLKLLREGKADLGFVQGGTDERSTKDENGIVSLGSLFVEPVWLFYREPVARQRGGQSALTSLTQLQGLRLNVGTPGSGVPALMAKLFDANKIDPARLQLSNLGDTPATMALLAGDIDAIVFASAPESLMVQMLLQTPGIQLMDFAQSEAYSRRFPFLTPAVLPQGVVDLSRNMPATDLRLVATTTELLAREHTHPALLHLFAQAALDLHSAAGWFNRAGAFPSTQHSEYPVSREAARTIAGGRPFLQRYLPFWLANLVERMWLALGVILALLLPLSRVVPPLYEFRIRSRVFRWYAQLRALELQMQEPQADPAHIARELDSLEHKVAGIHVPLSYVDELYALRSNIDLVRGKLAARA
jgi:hypothetical protein